MYIDLLNFSPGFDPARPPPPRARQMSGVLITTDLPLLTPDLRPWGAGTDRYLTARGCLTEQPLHHTATLEMMRSAFFIWLLRKSQLL